MALAPNRIAGTAWLKVDGEQYALRGDLTISIDSVEREGQAGMDGVHGYLETPRIPFIEGTFSDIGGMSLARLQGIVNSTVTAEVVSGKTYLLRNAWTSTARELNAAEGSVSVRFEGMSGAEIMA
jgi:hypothetical protein